MDRYLIIKTRDELLRIKIGHILYFEADRNYTKLLLSNNIQFTFAINIGKIEELLEKQVAGSNQILMRVGKSHITNTPSCRGNTCSSVSGADSTVNLPLVSFTG